MALQEKLDLAIVGAGPGGLACAAAFIAAFGSDAKVKVRLQRFVCCRRPAIYMLAVSRTAVNNLQVYESYKNFRPQGSGVLMQPNVQHALQALDPDLFAKWVICSLQMVMSKNPAGCLLGIFSGICIRGVCFYSRKWTTKYMEAVLIHAPLINVVKHFRPSCTGHAWDLRLCDCHHPLYMHRAAMWTFMLLHPLMCKHKWALH